MNSPWFFAAMAAFVCLTAGPAAFAAVQDSPAVATPGLPSVQPGQAESEEPDLASGLELTPAPATAATVETYGITCPPEYVPLVQKTTLALMAENFTFYPVKALDPFAPFIAADTHAAAQVRVQAEGEDGEQRHEAARPLTPLQKMTVSEIERGLKAITWGDLGRKAVIEDSTGKGYIVSVGTPVGELNGVIMQIHNDRLVIQQESWDRKAKKRIPQEFTVKLVKQAAAK